MCKFWRQEKCNHHFPELNRNNKILPLLARVFNWHCVASILVVATVAVGLTYLLETNQGSIQGYKINELENRIAQLQEENKKLNLDYISLQSMSNLISRVPELKLVAVDHIDIINSVGATVALK